MPTDILEQLGSLGWSVLALGLFGLLFYLLGWAHEWLYVRFLRRNLDVWTRAAKRHRWAVAALAAERGHAAPGGWEWNGDELGWSRDFAPQAIRIFVVPMYEEDRAKGWKWEASELDGEGHLLDGEVVFSGRIVDGSALDNILDAEANVARRSAA